MVISQQDRIAQVISALREYEPERIILFGSQARENADQYSDLDIVIIKKTDKRFLDRLKTIYDLVQPRFANGLPGGVPAEVYNEQDAKEAIALTIEVPELVEQYLGAQ